jgi:hypothetical protein
MTGLSVHSLVVAAVAQGGCAVGIGVVAEVFMHKRAHFANTLGSGQVNLQVSSAFIAMCFHFLQLQRLCLMTPYKGFNF